LVPWGGGGGSVTLEFTALMCHACGTARGLEEVSASGTGGGVHDHEQELLLGGVADVARER